MAVVLGEAFSPQMGLFNTDALKTNILASRTSSNYSIGFHTGGFVGLTFNCQFDPDSSSWLYVVDGTAVLMEYNGNNLKVNGCVSGTAGNAITWHELANFDYVNLGQFVRFNGLEFPELASPSAPISNRARIYAKDNGAGKTQLIARFPTGAEQVLATEP